MPIDITREELLSLTEIAQRLPARRAGKRTHVSCIWRWVTSGLRGIQLEAIRVGGVTCSSMPAVQRFFDALTKQRIVRGAPRTTTAAELARRQRVSREVDVSLRQPTEQRSSAETTVAT